MLKRWMAVIIMCALIFPQICYADGSQESTHENGSTPMFTASASDHILLLSYGGILSAWGNNSKGQVGQSGSTVVTEPYYLDKFAELKSVSSGGEFSLALDINGSVWSWGDNSSGQLGRNVEGQTSTHGKISDLSNIVSVCAGEKHALALDQDGNVWSWGDNSYGQLGRAGNSSNVPQRIDGLSHVQMISTKYNHNIAVDNEENVWGWGDNTKEQAGVTNPGTKNNIVTPTKYSHSSELNGTIKQIVVGKYHTAILSETEDTICVYTFGDDAQHQLGINFGIVGQTSTPGPILSLYKPKESNHIYELFAGEYRTILSDRPTTISDISPTILNIWGTGCYYSSNPTQNDYGIVPAYSDNAIDTPVEQQVYHDILAAGNTCTVAYFAKYKGQSSYVEVSGSADTGEKFGDTSNEPVRKYILEPDKEFKTMYLSEYESIPYYTVRVNFVELQSSTFKDENGGMEGSGLTEATYGIWEYVDKHTFKMKRNEIIYSTVHQGVYFHRPAPVPLQLPYQTINENRSVGRNGLAVWNFKIDGFSANSSSDSVMHGEEDGKAVAVDIQGVTIPQAINVFNDSPYPLSDSTKLGLYIYNLPTGITAEDVQSAGSEITLTLKGTSSVDLDYDMPFSICYVYEESGNHTSGVIGDYDKNTIRTAEASVIGFAIIAKENTPETLTISADSSITLGKENGKTLTAVISGGVFNETITPTNWSLSGCQDSVEIDKIERINDNTVRITLKGNSSDVYSSNKQVSVICSGLEYSDSREPIENGYKIVSLQSANAVEFYKRSHSSGGGGSFVLAAPSINIKSGTVVKGTQIILSTSTTNAKIYYTLDGSTPTSSSTLYDNPIIIEKDTTIKYIAVSGSINSNVTTAAYTVRMAKVSFLDGAKNIKFIHGYSDGTFKPDQDITRYEMIESLNKLLSVEKIDHTISFTDVSAEYTVIVSLFANADIIEGYGDNTFRGDKGLSRAEFVKIMATILKLDITDQESTFSDTKGHWADKYITVFSKLGYIKGYDDGTFKPDIEISRAEFVTIINRILNVKSIDLPPKYTDLQANYWAYKDIMTVSQ